MVVDELDVVLVGGVLDREALGGVARLLERLGDDRRDGAAAVRDVGRLEDEQLAVLDLGERRRVLVREDVDDAGQLARGAALSMRVMRPFAIVDWTIQA